MAPTPPGEASGSGDDLVVARSIVIPTGRSARRPSRTLPSALTRGVLADFNLREKSRQSKAPRRRDNPADLIEPPYDLQSLADLLFDSPDFYAVVDQLAQDVAGNGYDLIDAEPTDDEVEQGESEDDAQAQPRTLFPGAQGAAATRSNLLFSRDTVRDVKAQNERKRARSFLENVCFDFQGKRIKVEKLVQNVLMDYDSTGSGYIEVARLEPDGNEVIALYHLPSPMVRKRQDGSFVQLDQMGRACAFFRPFGSDPNDAESRHDHDEAAWSGQDEGVLKNELVEFRRYHPGELYYGIPPIIAALANVYGNIFSDDRNLRFFVNRALPDWVIELKASRSTLLDDQGKKILDQYENALREHLQYVVQGDDYRALLLKLPNEDVETTWTKLSMEVKDQEFAIYQGRNRDVMVRVYRMLPHRIGIIETASLGTGTGETQEETYKRAQVDPRQAMFEEFFDLLLDERGLTLVRFKFNEIDVIDETREMNLFNGAISSRALSLNECREWLSRIVRDQDFPPVDEDLADLPMWLVEMQSGAGQPEEAQAPVEGGLPGLPPPVKPHGLPGLPPPVRSGQGGGAQSAAGNGSGSGGAAPPPFAPAKRVDFGMIDPEFAAIRRRLTPAGRRNGRR